METTPEERRGIERIRRAHWQFWLVLSLELPVFWISLRRANHPKFLLMFTIIWAVIVVLAALRVAWSRCPRCGKYFHSNADFPQWRPLTNPSHCVNCRLPLRTERVIYPSLE